jgi:hypothetical protein
MDALRLMLCGRENRAGRRLIVRTTGFSSLIAVFLSIVQHVIAVSRDSIIRQFTDRASSIPCNGLKPS